MTSGRTLLVVGSGPGIGRAVASIFASKRYTNIVLLARRLESLKQEQAAIETVTPGINVKTYAVDVTDSVAVGEALDDADAALGKPECIFYNAARVLPSSFFDHDVQDIEYDFKVTFSFYHLQPLYYSRVYSRLMHRPFISLPSDTSHTSCRWLKRTGWPSQPSSSPVRHCRCSQFHSYSPCQWSRPPNGTWCRAST